MTKLRFILLIVLGVVLAAACRKEKEYPVEPVISFEGFVFLQDSQTGEINTGLLRIGYTDGDGDIGLDQGDTLFPYHKSGEYYYNLIIRYYEQQQGEFIEVPLIRYYPETQTYDTSTFSGRIPPLIPKDQKEAIKGIIEDEVFINNPLSDYDTIKFEVQLIDRALNKSNVISTPPIILDF
ncbi:MAG: hypothetical protein PHG67_08600 [Bacteroidales bacterium]|jgi:hypothetical protein|nr:hypothetical protein [Bacteroidales bacterium]HOI32496.1 hypothetical protein [Bacteroidales bacterium]